MVLPVISEDISRKELDDMMESALTASRFLKAISHEGRLMTLCYLASGEKSVTDIENFLSTRQAAVSQQLARLRYEGLVEARRDGKAIYYRLADKRATRILDVVYDIFCNNDCS